jgi:hypothetical protein
LFAGSPFINNILKRVRQEYITAVRRQLGEKNVEQWLADTKFTIDSDMGKAIQIRIQDWSTLLVNSLKDQSKADIVKIAKGYIDPFDYETPELDKLVTFIIGRLNAS